MQTDSVSNPSSVPSSAITAIDKFFEVNEDLHALQATSRRVLFECLRSGVTFSPTEAEHLHAIADLLADLGYAQQAA